MALRIGTQGEPTPDGLTPAEFARLYRLPPAEAVDYLARRRRLTETFDWRDLWQEEHLHQFTVSRLARLDLLEAVRAGIVKSVDGDLTRRDWLRDIRGLLERSGWWGEKQVVDPVTGETVTTVFDPPRLKLIYDTNTNQAYAAGLWERIERNKKTSPYIRYITQRDEKVRVTHQAWDNLALPVDHPFWSTHFPPNGWRCRCRAMSMSQAQYDEWKANGRIKTVAPPAETMRWVDKRSGEIHQVPIGIDPGFAYNPGKARASEFSRYVEQRLAQASGAMARAYKEEYAGALAAQVDQGVRPIARAVAGQSTWKELGLADIRTMGPGEPAPALIPAAATASEAVAVLRNTIGIEAGGQRAIDTPWERVSITDASLPHVVEKRADARERFAAFIEPTLLRPTEVWGVAYDDGSTRNRYIKLFEGVKHDILVMVRVEPDGSVFWNMMQRDRKGMNALRLGALLYPREVP